MASIHKDPKGRSPFWYCAFITADGKRRFKSTKAKDRKSAIEICRTWEKAARLAKSGKLTPERAREIVAEGVAVILDFNKTETSIRRGSLCFSRLEI